MQSGNRWQIDGAIAGALFPIPHTTTDRSNLRVFGNENGGLINLKLKLINSAVAAGFSVVTVCVQLNPKKNWNFLRFP